MPPEIANLPAVHSPAFILWRWPAGIDARGREKRKRRQEWMLLPASCNPNRKANRLAAAYYMCPVSAIFTIASVVKNALSTAPMLMYQHSRSAVSWPGR